MAEEKQAYPTQGPTAPQGAPPAYPGPQQPQPQPQYAPPGGPQYGAQYSAPPGQPVMHQPGAPVYVQGHPAPTNTVVFVQNQFRQSPVNCVCPHCHQNIITATEGEAGGLTWLLCAGICLFGFWLGCCLIPFCIDDCKDIRHSCPNCKNTIHVFRRL